MYKRNEFSFEDEKQFKMVKGIFIPALYFLLKEQWEKLMADEDDYELR